MAPTEGRVARPEQQWGCRCGTPWYDVERHTKVLLNSDISDLTEIHKQKCLPFQHLQQITLINTISTEVHYTGQTLKRWSIPVVLLVFYQLPPVLPEPVAVSVFYGIVWRWHRAVGRGHRRHPVARLLLIPAARSAPSYFQEPPERLHNVSITQQESQLMQC